MAVELTAALKKSEQWKSKSECTDIPEVFFTPHHEGHFCTHVIRRHRCALGLSCADVIPRALLRLRPFLCCCPRSLLRSVTQQWVIFPLLREFSYLSRVESPFYFHINSYAPSGHRWSYVTSPIGYKMFWSFPPSGVCLITVCRLRFVKKMFETSQIICVGPAQCWQLFWRYIFKYETFR
jgi:hypothetical protein